MCGCRCCRSARAGRDPWLAPAAHVFRAAHLMCALFWGRLWHLHASFDIKSKNNRQRFCVLCVCVCLCVPVFVCGQRYRAGPWPLRRLSIRPVFVLCVHINARGKAGERCSSHLIVVFIVVALLLRELWSQFVMCIICNQS